MSALEEITARLNALPTEELDAIKESVGKYVKDKPFTPLPGPQTSAYFSDADILLYGGSPGGGKTALEIGLALNEHKRSLILRREFVDLSAPIHTLENILNESNVGLKGLVKGNRPQYRKADGVINFMGLGDDFGGKQGLPHDLICFDEAAQFPEDYVRMCLGWLRTNIPGQRCRAIMASNPPLDSTGDWLIDFFAPWLDNRHPSPAEAGELRYFNPTNNEECSEDDVFELNGIKVAAQSRTYIPSRFTDNPYYNPGDYAKSLAGLPSTVRDRLITGDFMLARQDDEWQVIPTAWVQEAQKRWTQQPPQGVPMCSIGVDVAQGGMDKTVLAPRYDGWYAPVVSVPGEKTPHGRDVAGLVISHRRDNATIIIDMGGGYGGSPYEHLKENGVDVVGYKGAEASAKRTNDRQLGFFNKRAESHWKFREALDPSQASGSPIALPDDPEILADLTAPRFEVTNRGIKIEGKEEIKQRLGRSPDKGDAIVMAWAAGRTIAQQLGGAWRGSNSNGSAPQVVRAYAHRKR